MIKDTQLDGSNKNKNTRIELTIIIKKEFKLNSVSFILISSKGQKCVLISP